MSLFFPSFFVVSIRHAEADIFTCSSIKKLGCACNRLAFVKVAALSPRCGGGDENTYNGSRAQVVNVAAEWRQLEDDPDVIRTSEISGTALSLKHNATNFARGIGVRQVRLVCGLILFCYLLSHYINHSLGNVSLDAMEYGLRFHVALWHSVVGTLLLFAALAVHGSLGLWALYQRRYFRWRTAESVQLALGLSIPALMCAHLIGERLGATLYGLERSYAQALYNFWVVRPDLGVMQTVLLLVAWIHGCIGVYFWLRLKRFFPKMAPGLLGLAVLLPVLALLGFYQQGKTVELLAQQPEWRAQIQSPARIGTIAERDNLIRLRDCFLIFYAAAIALVFAARGVRLINERRGGMIRLTYPDREIRVPKGLTVLEASYRHHVPHANVCGGKGRCSTCRIRIVGDRSGLPEPSAREAFVLERVGASGDPAVRLACQLRPTRDITIVPLLPPQVGTSFVHGKTRIHPGEERYVVSMFVDMRGSTQMAADQLPFDTVFIVNRFLGAISQAVISSRGQREPVPRRWTACFVWR